MHYGVLLVSSRDGSPSILPQPKSCCSDFYLLRPFPEVQTEGLAERFILPRSTCSQGAEESLFRIKFLMYELCELSLERLPPYVVASASSLSLRNMQEHSSSFRFGAIRNPLTSLFDHILLNDFRRCWRCSRRPLH